MMQIASEVTGGKRLAIITVPLLTPRLSSYWLALVTDVDATTGRNLIDSMSTEVVVTDTSIRDLVPGRAADLRGVRTPRARRATGSAEDRG